MKKTATIFRSKRLLMAIVALSFLGIIGAFIWQKLRPPNLDEKIGQMLMFGFLGNDGKSRWANMVAQQIADGQMGGVVFLGHNFKTRAGVNQLTHLFSHTSARYQPFLALDMEGGFVQRLGSKLGYEKIPPAQITAQTQSPQEAKNTFIRLAQMSKKAGFNVNLAPVIDLLIDPKNPVVGKWQRSYGSDPEKVAAYAEQFVRAHTANGIMPVLKHFPGHGSSLSDSHDGFVDISKTWQQKELIPYKRLIESGAAPAIMPGHLILRNRKDPAGVAIPVSLSKPHITDLLRKKLKFNGLVITDDLQMAAIAKNYSYEQALILAINAGADMLMISNSRPPDKHLPQKTIAIIRRAVRNAKIPMQRIDSSFKRVLTAKAKLQISKKEK